MCDLPISIGTKLLTTIGEYFLQQFTHYAHPYMHIALSTPTNLMSLNE